MDASNWLDLRDLFVNEVAGSPYYFLFFGLIVIFLIAIYFRFPNGALIAIAALFLLIVVATLNLNIILGFIIVGIGTFLAMQIRNIIRP